MLSRDGIDLEIIEHLDKFEYPSGKTIPPDRRFTVRINGQEVLLSADEPIAIQGIDANDFMRVTLTLFVRDLKIKRETLY